MDERIYPLEILYDGKCAICRFDVAHLRQRNRHRRLEFTDISRAGFDPAPYGRSLEQLLARLHARRADGALLEGLDVFRSACPAVGLGWLVAPISVPGLRLIADRAYTWFARNRVRLSRQYGGIFIRLTPVCDTDVCSMARR